MNNKPTFAVWLKRKGSYPYEFARETGLCGVTVWKANKGEPIDKANALKIYKITNKKINLMALLYGSDYQSLLK